MRKAYLKHLVYESAPDSKISGFYFAVGIVLGNGKK